MALIYRETWKQSPPARPVTQDQVSNPDLILAIHGPGGAGLKKSHHDDVEGDPHYIWSGKCAGPWALSLRHKRLFIDFENGGVVRMRCKQSGPYRLRLIVRPCEGPWLVSEEGVGRAEDWGYYELCPTQLHWHVFDIVSACILQDALPLSLDAVESIGFTDLAAGDGSRGCSRLAAIEVSGAGIEK